MGNAHVLVPYPPRSPEWWADFTRDPDGSLPGADEVIDVTERVEALRRAAGPINAGCGVGDRLRECLADPFHS
ncbi:hypothetical protein [Streptomyces sp. S.PB5]|uniref:hypothetical protein n=1 Tax=Streptomyces sp. S.PB5 TaxID=3020844 RepID=UPI0025AF7BAB|nr:hypothetical protein [Streptomyces sp. S.PB5]MDN3026395.1 hypothetical protein [Streptomyces sp. S.PB5]